MVTTSDGITTAGATFSHVDLALAIVRMRSPALADLVRRYLVVDGRASQAAYTIPSALAQYDPLVSAFEQWVRTRLDEPLSIAGAAHDLEVSERTLQRTAARTLGCPPIRFVQDLRVDRRPICCAPPTCPSRLSPAGRDTRTRGLCGPCCASVRG